MNSQTYFPALLAFLMPPSRYKKGKKPWERGWDNNEKEKNILLSSTCPENEKHYKVMKRIGSSDHEKHKKEMRMMIHDLPCFC